jgi:hypothetical protein
MDGPTGNTRLPEGKNLLRAEAVPLNSTAALPAWGAAIIEEGVR